MSEEPKAPIVLRRTLRVRITRWCLYQIERLYIWAHGWTRDRKGFLPSKMFWQPPADYPFRNKGPYELRHAVNAQHAVYAHETHQRRTGSRP